MVLLDWLKNQPIRVLLPVTGSIFS